MNATPLKEAELRTLARCAVCEKLLGQTGTPIFFKTSLELHFLNPAAVQRQQGLTNLLGGSARLAAVMGQDEDMTSSPHPAHTFMICNICARQDISILEVFDRVNRAAQATTPAS
jgi:hypothetical protein